MNKNIKKAVQDYVNDYDDCVEYKPKWHRRVHPTHKFIPNLIGKYQYIFPVRNGKIEYPFFASIIRIFTNTFYIQPVKNSIKIPIEIGKMHWKYETFVNKKTNRFNTLAEAKEYCELEFKKKNEIPRERRKQ